MAESNPIFRKLRLTPGQLRAVAERRFEDAVCLLQSGDNARATGAMYVGGFTIECLLKALLLERHRNLQGPVDPATLSVPDRQAYFFLYSHELDAILAYLPEVKEKLVVYGAGRRPLWADLRKLCAEWSVYARYSPRTADVATARRFIDTIREVKSWLRTI